MNSEGVNLACAIESTTTFDQDSGYGSDHININGPEDCGHSDDVHDENADDDGVSLSRTSENEEQESHYGLQDLLQQVKGG